MLSVYDWMMYFRKFTVVSPVVSRHVIANGFVGVFETLAEAFVLATALSLLCSHSIVVRLT